MGLEAKTLGNSPGLNVELITVSFINKDKKGYEIISAYQDPRESGITIGNTGKNFVEKLKKGDKLIVVSQGNSYLAVCGPLNEDEIYTYGR